MQQEIKVTHGDDRTTATCGDHVLQEIEKRVVRGFVGNGMMTFPVNEARILRDLLVALKLGNVK